MGGSLILVLVGAMLSISCLVGLVAPTTKIFSATYSKSVVREIAKVALSFLTFVSLIVFIIFAHEQLSNVGALELPEPYLTLTSDFAAEFFLGVLLGPLLLYWVKMLTSARLTSAQKRSQYALSVAICALIILSITYPYIGKWLGGATAIDIAKVLKITMESRAADQEVPGFVSSGAGTDAASSRGGPDLLGALHNLDMLGNPNASGMLSRDENFIRYIVYQPGENARQLLDNNENIRKERVFMAQVHLLTKCLIGYANAVDDPRLLMIDMKPLISKLADVVRFAAQSDALHQKKEQINRDFEFEAWKLTAQARQEIISYSAECPPNPLMDLSTQTQDLRSYFEHTQPNAKLVYSDDLPYKTIALAYLLSAIGSSDTAVVVLTSWINRHSDNSRFAFFNARAQIERNIILQSTVSDFRRSDLYFSDIKKLVEDFGALLPDQDIVVWSKGPDCQSTGGDSQPSPDEQQKHIIKTYLEFIYFTQRNLYVKASTSTDRMSDEVLKIAADDRDANLDCFRKLNYLDKNFFDEKGWRGEVLSNHAQALLARSYEQRLYGQLDHPDQRRMREAARIELSDAVSILDEDVRTERHDIDLKKTSADTGANSYFDQASWQTALETAKNELAQLQAAEKRD